MSGRKASPESPPRWSRRRLLFGVTLLAWRPGIARAATLLSMTELYKSFGVRGFEFSDRALALRGHDVTMQGYMAPPLKPESAFFVLTREPLALCPFCQSDADWPVDIVVVYLRRASALVSAGERITVTGKLEVGSWTDPETGFVSQIRIVDASYYGA
jgi:hypothetical protein